MADQLLGPIVETLGDERIALDEEDVTGSGVERGRGDRAEPFRFERAEAAEVELSRLDAGAGRGVEEEALAVGEELGKRWVPISLPSVECASPAPARPPWRGSKRGRRERSVRRRCDRRRSRCRRGRPSSAPSWRECAGRRRQIGDLEAVLREEAEPPAVGRPERVARVRRVPRPSRRSGSSSERTQSAVRPSSPRATSARRRPSAESAGRPLTKLDRDPAGSGNTISSSRVRPRFLDGRRAGRCDDPSRAPPRQPSGEHAATHGQSIARSGGIRRRTEGRLVGRPPLATSSSTIRASAMSCSRFFGLRSRQRRSSRRIAGGTPAAARRGRSRRISTPASVSGTESPANSRRPVSISKSTTPNAQMSARLSTALPFACSGLMYAAVPRITPSWVPCAARQRRRVRQLRRRRRHARVRIERLRQPEVEDFDFPSMEALMFCGLRSR
jgi:hypothetical protein